MINMSNQEKVQEFANWLFVSTGTVGVTTVTVWQDIDMKLGILLKLISLLSFFCFLLINQDKIKEGWSNLISKFKRKG